MTKEFRTPTFWGTVRLLLATARRRAAGRRKRQQELLNQRAKKGATNWGGLGFAFAVLLMAIVNGGAAFVARMAVDGGARVEAERQGKIVVSGYFLHLVREAVENPDAEGHRWLVPSDFSLEAQRLAERYGGSESGIEQKLIDAFRRHGDGDFVTRDEVSPGLRGLANAGRVPAFLGSVILLWWTVMLVFQGEGLELDLQRRRHPMWEWLFAHPVPPGAMFLAEMLSPIAANPIYWSAPLFTGILYGTAYGEVTGMAAALVIGVPVTVAAACLGKALEIGTILRFGPRTRGALMGVMGWLGYASMMLFVVGAAAMPKVITAVAGYAGFAAAVPWPWLRWFLGGRPDGSFSFLAGMMTCWVVAGATVAGAVRFSVWATEKGLTGNFGGADARPAKVKRGVEFGREPLYRKEMLWFVRDRSAIVQVILVPLTIASVQAFNLRGVLSYAQGAWNYLCGMAILFGTYFLWILGPKSLASEGTALWIALTWPRGLEALLKAKAWLWSLISSGIVVLVLGYAAVMFPGNAWQIGLVGVGWFFFARSMAEKSVTLVTVVSSSGEPEKIHWGRRMATQLGMMTFAIGVLTRQWPIAVNGIVYSYITAAAMWQNFRARLPYLYDPWSEEAPAAPTLMHAMIAISILVEGGAVLTGMVTATAGRENIAIAQAVSYGIAAVAVSIGTASFLGGRGVTGRDVWRWGADIPTQGRLGWDTEDAGEGTPTQARGRLELIG